MPVTSWNKRLEHREDLSARGLGPVLSMGLPCLEASLALALLTVLSSSALPAMGCEHSTAGDATVELGTFKLLHMGTDRRKTCTCLLLDKTSELGEGRVCPLRSASPLLAVTYAKHFLGTVCGCGEDPGHCVPWV